MSYILPWGKIGSEEVKLVVLKNDKDIEVEIITYGGIIRTLNVPDKTNNKRDVVTGYDTLEEYLKDDYYFGCLIGRYGNRIGRQGQFTINGKDYQLAANNQPDPNNVRCHLHGGLKGYNQKIWKIYKSRENEVVLTYLSVDGEEGYPGTILNAVTYRLPDGSNTLEIEYNVESQDDLDTYINVTQHTYFNLHGMKHESELPTILDHTLQLNAETYADVDSAMITTGKLTPVEGTPFDFRKPEKIGARIEDPDKILQFGPGYDHSYTLQSAPSSELITAAIVSVEESGIRMTVRTTEPAV